MGIHVQQDQIQPTIILWTMTGHWSVADLEQALQVNAQLLAAATQRMDFVIDISRGGLIPPQFIGFLRKYKSSHHPMEGFKVVIGADHYLRIFWQGLSDYLPRYWQVHFADSMVAARALLAKQRDSIPS